MRQGAASALALAIVWVMGCGGGKSATTPTSPAPPSKTVTSVSVAATGQFVPLSAGQSVQLRATATYSDATQSDCTSTAAWATSDSTVASVSATGLLSANRAGAVDIKATLSGVTGSLHLAVGQGSPAWRVALLVFRSIDVSYRDKAGTAKRFTYTLPDVEVRPALSIFNNTASLAWTYSDGNAVIQSDVIETDSVLTSLTDGGSVYGVSPRDVRAELDRFAPPGRYDSVIVFCPSLNVETREEIPTPGWGWAFGPPSAESNGATFAVVRNVYASTYGGPTAPEVFLHEWLHGVCAYYSRKGYAMPAGDADAGSHLGYKSDSSGWSVWYHDLMTGRVLVNGVLTGIGPAAWASGTPLTRP